MAIYFGRLFLFIFLICAQNATAQIQSSDPKAAKRTIVDVIEWVRRDGTEAKLSRDVARDFGWGEADMSVTRMAFSNRETQIRYAFDILRERPDVVMFWMSPSEGIFWRLSPSGELLQTLHATKAGGVLVENSVYLAKFREARAVFIERIP